MTSLLFFTHSSFSATLRHPYNFFQTLGIFHKFHVTPFQYLGSSRARKPTWREINHQMVFCSANGSFPLKNPFSKRESTSSDSRFLAAFGLFPYPFEVSSFPFAANTFLDSPNSGSLFILTFEPESDKTC